MISHGSAKKKKANRRIEREGNVYYVDEVVLGGRICKLHGDLMPDWKQVM